MACSIACPPVASCEGCSGTEGTGGFLCVRNYQVLALDGICSPDQDSPGCSRSQDREGYRTNVGIDSVLKAMSIVSLTPL